MNKQILFRIGIFFISLILVLTATFFIDNKTPVENENSAINLIRPSFLQVVHAEGEDFDIGQMLDEEAGISAYYESSVPIDLDLVRDQFRTIETETSDYIIGSVPIVNYVEHYDVHAYVHKDGWVLAYYLKDAPAAKIIDIKAHTIDSNKLDQTISTITGAAGVPFTGETYYDFRYPNATNMMLIYEDKDNGRDFTIELTPSFGYYERSWTAYSPGDSSHFFHIDGVQPTWFYHEYKGTGYGFASGSELSTGIEHVITVDDEGALVLIYLVP